METAVSSMPSVQDSEHDNSAPISNLGFTLSAILKTGGVQDVYTLAVYTLRLLTLSGVHFSKAGLKCREGLQDPLTLLTVKVMTAKYNVVMCAENNTEMGKIISTNMSMKPASTES